VYQATLIQHSFDVWDVGVVGEGFLGTRPGLSA